MNNAKKSVYIIISVVSGILFLCGFVAFFCSFNDGKIAEVIKTMPTIHGLLVKCVAFGVSVLFWKYALMFSAKKNISIDSEFVLYILFPFIAFGFSILYLLFYPIKAFRKKIMKAYNEL